MNRHLNTIFLIVLLSILDVSAQNERNRWYFGRQAGMDLSNNNYSSLDDNNIERTITFGVTIGPNNIICANDEDGDLMFYSDGNSFKNRFHQNMMNSPTFENITFYSQAAMVRDPGNPNRYYVFVTVQENSTNRLTYTVVDMTLDGGLGGVVADKRHIRLTRNTGEHIVTARHANGRDVWLITTKNGNCEVYLINQTGISPSLISSNLGLTGSYDGAALKHGMMEVSPNNKLIAIAFPRLKKFVLSRFNNSTGTLDPIFEDENVDQFVAEEPGRSLLSLEFSLNSKVLYAAFTGGGVQQYNLSDLDNIPTPIQVASGTYSHLKRGPNGEIFNIQFNASFIGAIEQPNLIGPGCGFNNNVLELSRSNLTDLPTFLLPKYSQGISFINICEGETTEINLTGSFNPQITTIEWDLGDGTIAEGQNIEHTYTTPGTYSVTANVVDNGFVIQTYTEQITIYATPNVNTPETVYSCTQNTPFYLYEYSEDILNGLNSFDFIISYYLSREDAELKNDEIVQLIPSIGTQTVWARIENRMSPACNSIINFNIVTPEFITIDIATEQYLCDIRNGLTLTAPDGFLSYAWSTGSSEQSIFVDDFGRYTLTVIKDLGEFTCEAQTTIEVKPGDLAPTIEDIKVIDWSQNHNSIKVILEEDGNYEYSLNGIDYQASPVFSNLPLDDYIVYVRDANCQREVMSDELFLLYYDKFFTPNDDGVNDYWQVINSAKEEHIEIHIVNRYGRTMAILDYNDRGWDGRHNGVPLPSDDYWFRVVRNNGDVHFGHFTLKR